MQEKTKILIIDDEEIMRNLFRDIFIDEGYHVVIASDGYDGIVKAQEQVFAVAFIDIHMPGMDGRRTLRELKKVSPQTVCITTDSFPPYIPNSEELFDEAYSCIHKPFNIHEVKLTVRSILKDVTR